MTKKKIKCSPELPCEYIGGGIMRVCRVHQTGKEGIYFGGGVMG